MKNCTDTGLSVDVRDLCYRYPNSRQLLVNVTFEAKAGDRVCIVGPMMSGKTTLCRLIGGYLRPNVGLVSVCGEVICSLGLGIAPGDFSTLREFTSYKVNEFNLDEIVISDVLKQCDLTGLSKYQLRQMGSSIRIRVALYLLFMCRSKIIIVDMVPVGRDPETQDIIMPLIEEFSASGGIVIFTSRKVPPSKLANVVVQIA